MRARHIGKDAFAARTLQGNSAAKVQLGQQAAAMLREIILSGELAPGERLMEGVISERLGMSRTPVREAFRTLAAERLIELLPNRVVVREVEIGEMPDVFAVLTALEALAGEYACRRMTGDQVDRLAELQDQLQAEFYAGDHFSYSETSRLIHELIVEGSGNAALISAWRMALPQVQRARTLENLDRPRWRQSVIEHRKILEALAARDTSLVTRLINVHFADSVAFLGQAGQGAEHRPKEDSKCRRRPHYIGRRGADLPTRDRRTRS